MTGGTALRLAMIWLWLVSGVVYGLALLGIDSVGAQLVFLVIVVAHAVVFSMHLFFSRFMARLPVGVKIIELVVLGVLLAYAAVSIVLAGVFLLLMSPFG